MQNMRCIIKRAFTFMEIVLCMTLLGIIAAVMLNTMKSTIGNIHEKTSKTKVYKTLLSVQEASANIRQHESAKCPMQTFIMNIAGTYEFVFLNGSGANANASEVLATYMNYLKFQTNAVNFCDYTSYCNDSNIKGGKLPGDIYIGFKVYASVGNCPNYYLPDNASALTGRGKCWGELYIKLADQYNNSNTLGKDVFVYGMDKDGVVY